jgi:hypothetical protein
MGLVLLFAFNVLEADGHGRYPRAFSAFHESLRHHGEWVYYGHDVYAWRPTHVYYGWQPYTVGHWVWTVDGWYWESDEPWGWATYHYGRWAYEDYYGWVWIPDLEWGPAWVEWRSGPSCVGWAPLGPHSLFHVSIGFVWAPRVVPVHHWVFVDYGNMVKPRVHHHLLSSKDKKKHYEQTAGKNSGDRRTFGNVPDRRDVERRGNVRVTETKVRKETIDGRRPNSGQSAPAPRIIDRSGETRIPGVDPKRKSTPDRVTPNKGDTNRRQVESRSDFRIVEKSRGLPDRGEKDNVDTQERSERSSQRVTPGR